MDVVSYNLSKTPKEWEKQAEIRRACLMKIHQQALYCDCPAKMAQTVCFSTTYHQPLLPKV